MVHTSCRRICHSSEPQLPLSISPVPDPKAWDIDALNINWSALTAYGYPLTALLQRVIQKIRQCYCLIIVVAPGWPGIPWFWDLVQLSTEIPLQLPVSTTFLKQSHNYVFHSNPQHLNLHAWCLGVNSSKNKASLWRWQRELLHLRGHQQEPSTSQSGPYLRSGAEKIRWTSPLPSVKQVSDFFMYLYQDLNRRPSTIDGYRTAIVDTLGQRATILHKVQTFIGYSPAFTGIVPKVPGIFLSGTFLFLISSQKHHLSLCKTQTSNILLSKLLSY